MPVWLGYKLDAHTAVQLIQVILHPTLLSQPWRLVPPNTGIFTMILVVLVLPAPLQ